MDVFAQSNSKDWYNGNMLDWRFVLRRNSCKPSVRSGISHPSGCRLCCYTWCREKRTRKKRTPVDNINTSEVCCLSSVMTIKQDLRSIVRSSIYLSLGLFELRRRVVCLALFWPFVHWYSARDVLVRTQKCFVAKCRWYQNFYVEQHLNLCRTSPWNWFSPVTLTPISLFISF